MSEANGTKTLVEILGVLRSIDGRIERLERGQERLEGEMRAGFAAVNGRLDNLIELSGEKWRDHEERLRRIEERLKAS